MQKFNNLKVAYLSFEIYYFQIDKIKIAQGNFL